MPMLVDVIRCQGAVKNLAVAEARPAAAAPVLCVACAAALALNLIVGKNLPCESHQLSHTNDSRKGIRKFATCQKACEGSAKASCCAGGVDEAPQCQQMHVRGLHAHPWTCHVANTPQVINRLDMLARSRLALGESHDQGKAANTSVHFERWLLYVAKLEFCRHMYSWRLRGFK